MNAMNQIIIEGNVVRTPTLKETPRGTKVCTMPIAVNHFYKDSAGNDVDEVGFYDVESWGDKFTDRIAKLAMQGRGVRIVGRLKQDRWKDSDGKKHSKVFIVAEHVDFKPIKKSSADGLPAKPLGASSIDISAAEEQNLAVAAEGIAQEETVF